MNDKNILSKSFIFDMEAGTKSISSKRPKRRHRTDNSADEVFRTLESPMAIEETDVNKLRSDASMSSRPRSSQSSSIDLNAVQYAEDET